MKKRYWLVALILFGIGLFCYFFVHAYQFTGIILCALAVLRLIFGVLNLCKRKIFFTVFCVLVTASAVAMVATGIWILSRASGSDEAPTDYVVVLGAGVNGTQPGPSLYERLVAAKEFAEEHPEAILILTGGRGEGKQITEAQCMFNWLTENGVPAGRLRMEEKATSTEENLKNSLELIEAECGRRPECITVISSEYHLLRAELIAKNLGVTAVCIPAHTRHKLYFCNMFAREIFAVWKTLIG